MKGKTLIILVTITFVLATIGALLASGNPDGLERVAADLDFNHGEHAVISSPIPDYEVPGISSAALRTSLAGVLGAGAVGLLAAGVSRMLRPRK